MGILLAFQSLQEIDSLFEMGPPMVYKQLGF